jgi:cytochrome c nitrite reductase small subunit
MREHYDGWQKAAHHPHAVCNDCHVPQGFFAKYLAKSQHGWRHSKAFTLGGFHEPIRITPEDREIVRRNCVRCHAELVSGLGASGAHGAAGAEAADCLHCHAQAGHGPRR